MGRRPLMIASSRGVLKGPCAMGCSEYGSWLVSSSHSMIPMVYVLGFIVEEGVKIIIYKKIGVSPGIEPATSCK